jgi:ABC-type transporter MlaC component
MRNATPAGRAWSIMMLRYLAIGALVLAWGVSVSPLNANAAYDPKSFIQGIGVLRQNLPRKKVDAQLNAIWLQAFDVEGIGRAVLGKHWGASEEQREAYIELFPKYIAKLYAIQFSDYSARPSPSKAASPPPTALWSTRRSTSRGANRSGSTSLWRTWATV